MNAGYITPRYTSLLYIQHVSLYPSHVRGINVVQYFSTRNSFYINDMFT